jgi:hypothetical protein
VSDVLSQIGSQAFVPGAARSYQEDAGAQLAELIIDTAGARGRTP